MIAVFVSITPTSQGSRPVWQWPTVAREVSQGLTIQEHRRWGARMAGLLIWRGGIIVNVVARVSRCNEKRVC